MNQDDMDLLSRFCIAFLSPGSPTAPIHSHFENMKKSPGPTATEAMGTLVRSPDKETGLLLYGLILGLAIAHGMSQEKFRNFFIYAVEDAEARRGKMKGDNIVDFGAVLAKKSPTKVRH